jgi:hypothetical protein
VYRIVDTLTGIRLSTFFLKLVTIGFDEVTKLAILVLEWPARSVYLSAFIGRQILPATIETSIRSLCYCRDGR